MKLKDKQALLAQTPDELQSRLETLRREVVETKLKLKAGQIKDTQAVGKKRQEIAMIMTKINQIKEAE